MKKFLLVIAMLLALGALSANAQDDMAATVNVGGNDELGTFLVSADSMTLYIFTNDEFGVSNCVDACAEAWPPLLLGEGEFATAGPGVSGVLGVISREDGSSQVTYNGAPLYFWAEDAAPGDATGQGVGDVWFVAEMPAIGLASTDELGTFLVDANGFTLYTFTNDEAGVSNCVDACAEAWPPVVAADDMMAAQPGLVGEIGTIERADGTSQVTFNGAPLYLWVEDAAPGDTTGQNVGEVWFVAKPVTMTIASNDEFGDILVGPNGMTLYTFTNDEASLVSNCNDACAQAWPPLTVAEGEEPVIDGAIGGEIAVIERADGRLQVAYNGEPLYYWFRDTVPGDTSGNNVGDVWFVAQP